MEFKILLKNKKIILALGPESDGNFSVYKNEKIYFFKSFGNLLEEKKFLKFKKVILDYLKKNKIKPDIILTDLHPLYKTTAWGMQLAKKYKAKHIQIQHHLAHIFSCYGERKLVLENTKLTIKNYKIKNSFIGVACDGTGYGLDKKIWGGEIFKFFNFSINLALQNKANKQFLIFNKTQNSKFKIQRIGHLENQTMIGGDLAVKEPARMLIAILDKCKAQSIKQQNKIQNSKFKKDFIYKFVKKYYTYNQFKLLYNQLQQNFNCQETSSTGRILDAVSVLLGFCKNQRNYKHEPIDLLEKNSTIPYSDLKPKIVKIINYESKIMNYELFTTPLFEYLIKNLNLNKKRLATTAQFYIAKGLYEIIKKNYDPKFIIHNSYFAGGIANNKIISSYLESKGVYTNKKIPCGDAGLSFGQIIYYLLTNSRN
ncbi:MAG: hypothetical protein ABH818_02885 [Patescibacteria group bacterium]